MRIIFTVLFSLTALGFAQGEKRIYIANDDHTDYMWRADEETYRQAFLDMLDYYLDLADATENEPCDFQSRFNCDGNFWVWTYEKYKSAAEFAKLIQRIRSGHIGVPLNPLVICYGGVPAEAVLRSMYYAGSLERRYRLRFPIAISMENQTLPYGLGALWAGAGAKYSWKGVCACLTQIDYVYGREHEAYWWVGQDGSKILMKWNSMVYHGNQGIGGYAEAYDTFGVIDFVDADPYFQSIYPYRIIGVFGKGWDELQVLTDEFVRAAKEKSRPDRRVIVSNEQDFFEDFEATYGDQLPQLSCSFGNEWDLYCASMAEVSARVKRSVEKLRTAEAMAALVVTRDATFMAGREQARDLAWMNMGLYFEHAWTADGHISKEARAAWQRRTAQAIEAYVESLFRDAKTRLAEMIPAGPFPRFYVFNSLSWLRTDYVDLPYEGPFPCVVVDVATGEELPAQRSTMAGKPTLRVLASGVPPVGYRVLEVRPGQGRQFPDWSQVEGGTAQTDSYRLVLAGNGAITSLVDKRQGNPELAGQAGGLNNLGPGAGTVELEEAGPVSLTLKATCGTPLPHVTRVTLARDVDRIEIENTITSNFSELYTWDFDYTPPGAEVWHEEVGAVILARLTSEGGHYSPHTARYDWLTLNHFADVGGNGPGFVFSNADCYFMRLGNSRPNWLDVATPRISVLAGGQVDGPDIGIPNQGGDRYFLQRFALRGRFGFSPVQAMRFALEHQNPLVAGKVGGGSALPADTFSLVQIDNPEVLLWAIKPAEENPAGELVVRVWNLGARASDFRLSLGGVSINRALRLSHIETPLGEATCDGNSVVSPINQQQLLTLGLAIESPSGLLPAQGLEAVLEGHAILLRWRSPYDPKVRGFRVEKSIGGGSYEDVAFVEPQEGGLGDMLEYTWRDFAVPKGLLIYRIATLGSDGSAWYCAPVRVEASVPDTFGIRGCFPNPAAGQLQTLFVIPEEPTDSLHLQATLLAVYNLQGQMVRKLVDKPLPPGFYTTAWDARDEHGQPVSSGIYLCVLQHGDRTDSRRMVILR
ncbi:MAG: T9SS type A sorting domain-containing protein [bacterium]|jgi:alpha-mannosidase|nr:T9SS type A sorting domain-containing protein [candidate division KSB1 bacterium]MDH7559513.1 T9SS type A sorting domain-containing protein [bacterium]